MILLARASLSPQLELPIGANTPPVTSLQVPVHDKLPQTNFLSLCIKCFPDEETFIDLRHHLGNAHELLTRGRSYGITDEIRGLVIYPLINFARDFYDAYLGANKEGMQKSVNDLSSFINDYPTIKEHYELYALLQNAVEAAGSITTPEKPIPPNREFYLKQFEMMLHSVLEFATARGDGSESYSEQVNQLMDKLSRIESPHLIQHGLELAKLSFIPLLSLTSRDFCAPKERILRMISYLEDVGLRINGRLYLSIGKVLDSLCQIYPESPELKFLSLCIECIPDEEILAGLRSSLKDAYELLTRGWNHGITDQIIDSTAKSLSEFVRDFTAIYLDCTAYTIEGLINDFSSSIKDIQHYKLSALLQNVIQAAKSITPPEKLTFDRKVIEVYLKKIEAMLRGVLEFPNARGHEDREEFTMHSETINVCMDELREMRDSLSIRHVEWHMSQEYVHLLTLSLPHPYISREKRERSAEDVDYGVLRKLNLEPSNILSIEDVLRILRMIIDIHVPSVKLGLDDDENANRSHGEIIPEDVIIVVGHYTEESPKDNDSKEVDL